jgi:hypothetical protein
MLGLVFGMVSFTSCGGDGDDDGDDSGATYSKKNLEGIWTGYNDDKSLCFVVAFYQDNTTKMNLLQKAENGYVTIQSSEGTYEYNTSNGVITVTYSDDNTTETFTVANQQYSSFTLYIGNNPFHMTRYTDSSDSGKPGSGSGSGGGSGYSGDSGSSSRTECSACKGSGKCTDIYNGHACNGSTKCWKCNGKGYYLGSSGSRVPCPYCDEPGKVDAYHGDTYGNGVCAKCGGSGNCQKCGGSGYVD